MWSIFVGYIHTGGVAIDSGGLLFTVVEFPSTEDLNLSLYLILPTLEEVIARFNSTCVSSCGIMFVYIIYTLIVIK